MRYNNLTEDQFNEAYTYFIKELVNYISEFHYSTVSNKSEVRIKIQRLCIEFDKIRKARGDAPIPLAKYRIGDTSAYLDFF